MIHGVKALLEERRERWLITSRIAVLAVLLFVLFGAVGSMAWALGPADEEGAATARSSSGDSLVGWVELTENDAKNIKEVLRLLRDGPISGGGHRITQASSKNTEGPSTDTWVALLVPLGAFAMVVMIVALVLGFRVYSERIRHQTIRNAIDHGVEVPPELLSRRGGHYSDFRRGIILCLGGVGLCIALLISQGFSDGSWGIGVFPLLIGLGYLTLWETERRGIDGSSGFRM